MIPLSFDHLLNPVCKNFDFVTGELCPPLLLNFPWSANTSFSCCIFALATSFSYITFSACSLSVFFFYAFASFSWSISCFRRLTSSSSFKR